MSRLPIPGDDADIWGDVLNDFLSVAHLTDGSLKPSAVQVADGSITPAKLSQAYITVSEKGTNNGVASLDGSGKVPVGQLPPGVVAGDATTSAKGIVQLAGDLAGTAAAPTVPALSTKINSSEKGALNGVATLDGTGKVTSTQLPATADATTSAKGIVQLAGDLAGTAASPTVPGLSSKANDASVVHLSGTETITGAKTFSVSPTVPGPSVGGDAANKTYVDNTVASSSAPDATTSSKGIVQLAGDLAGTATAPTVPGLASKVNTSAVGSANGVASLDGTGKVPAAQIPASADATTSTKGIVQLAGDLAGTAASPTVPGLAGKADKTTTITAGTGLTGGGDLSANRTLTVTYGTIAGTAAQGNDARITGAEQTSNKGAVNGYASLDGSGKVPTSQIPAVADATTSTKGIVQLAGDLAGTAASPTVPALANKVNTSQLGAPSGVATLNASGQLTAAQAPSQVLPYSMSSALSVTTGAIRLYNYSGAAWTIVGVSAAVDTPPTGSSIIVDIKVSGTTIFTTQANRPTIAAGTNASGHVTNMDVTTVANGAYLTVDVAQVGSTTAGADLCVQVEVR